MNEVKARLTEPIPRKGSGHKQIPKNKLAKGLAIVKTGGCLTPDPLRGIGSEETYANPHRVGKRNFKTSASG